jgi:hypothetical protein
MNRGIIIVCSYARDDGYYCTQSFDGADRGLADDRNVPVWATAAPERWPAGRASSLGVDCANDPHG